MTDERDARAAIATGDAPDEYVMGRTSAERGRLRKQAAMLEPATRRVFERAGVGRGMTCVDVGCGAGDVMRLMAEFVGPRGSVTGADCDPAASAETLSDLRAGGEGRFNFVRCDLETAEEIDGAPFDIVFARLVLIHSRDPVRLLRKMHGWTKPGGLVVVQDYDMRTIDLHPRLEEWSELQNTFWTTFDRLGIDWRIGSKMPAHFVEAGIGAPDGTDVWGHLAPLSETHDMYLSSYRSVLPKAAALGVTTEERGRALHRAVEEAVASGRHHASFWPLLIGTWKRRAA